MEAPEARGAAAPEGASTSDLCSTLGPGAKAGVKASPDTGAAPVTRERLVWYCEVQATCNQHQSQSALTCSSSYAFTARHVSVDYSCMRLRLTRCRSSREVAVPAAYLRSFILASNFLIPESSTHVCELPSCRP